MKKILLLSVFLLAIAVQAGTTDKLNEEAVLASIRERTETIDRLIRSFSPNNSVDLNKAILYALGELRAKQAVPLLLENLEYGMPTGNIKWFPKYGPCPACTALSRIGLPAVPAILAEIKKQHPSGNVGLLAGTLIDMGGAGFAHFLLSEEIKHSTDKSEIQRLQLALLVVEKQLERERQNSVPQVPPASRTIL